MGFVARAAGGTRSRATVRGGAILAARLPGSRHLDGLDPQLGAHLGEGRVAALGLDLGGVPLPVGGAVCVGESHFISRPPCATHGDVVHYQPNPLMGC